MTIVKFKKDKNAGQETYYSNNGFEIYNRDRGEWMVYDRKEPEEFQLVDIATSLAKAKKIVKDSGF